MKSKSQRRAFSTGKNNTTESSDSNSNTSSVSQYVLNFVRQRVAPSQRAQSDLSFVPGMSGANYNLNLVPQSTRLPESKDPKPWRIPCPDLIKPSSKRCPTANCRVLSCVSKSKHPLVVSRTIPQKLNQLWSGYARTVVNWPRLIDQIACAPPARNAPASQLENVLRMNLIGSKVHIIRSTAACLAGREGVVIMETRHLFRIAVSGGDDHPGQLADGIPLVSVPKAGTIFALSPPHLTMNPSPPAILLSGNQLAYRAVDRVIRKWRRPTVKVLVPGCGVPSPAEVFASVLADQ
ncbi:unnamed protein product [Calicophoron daubneyi]|uniref:Ribonuclease P protein subunit p29 n=1 Tax=Calicophoron daubneyi TaxID=300641 RepID=A0AAV2TGI0_CALDB